MGNSNERVEPSGVARPLGLYSHAWKVPAGSELLYLSGQVAVDENGEVVGLGNLAVQVEQVFRNLERVLAAAGFDFSDVVKVNTYLLRGQELESYRDARTPVYERYFPDARYPASTLVVIDALAGPHYLIEVEAVAARTP
jgi:2-iminobutanoate/2-iminopropanoate deaminase